MKKKLVKILIVLFACVVTLFYIGPLITTGDHSIGVILGLGFALLLVLYVIFFDKINKVVAGICNNKIGKILSSLVIVVLCISIGVGSVAFSNIVKYSNTSDTSTEYAILLGCKVNGTQPGVFLRARINSAYDYLNNNPNSKIILSGGQGNNEDISEAQCMYNALIDLGITDDRMILEENSTSTEENFMFSKDLMKQKGIDLTEITVITNDFHEYRASKYAQRFGIKTYSHPCKTPWNGYMPFATREVIAVIYQIYLGLHR